MSDRPAETKVIARTTNRTREGSELIIRKARLWDCLSVKDREAFIERGVVLNTFGGKMLHAVLGSFYQR